MDSKLCQLDTLMDSKSVRTPLEIELLLRRERLDRPRKIVRPYTKPCIMIGPKMGRHGDDQRQASSVGSDRKLALDIGRAGLQNLNSKDNSVNTFSTFS